MKFQIIKDIEKSHYNELAENVLGFLVFFDVFNFFEKWYFFFPKNYSQYAQLTLKM